jgi:hypothetical protein
MRARWGSGWGILAGALVVMLVIGAGGWQVAAGQGQAVASLDPVQGLVQVRAAGASEDDWQTITARQLVSEGDAIRTDDVGLAYLVFFEGVETEIRPLSQVEVTHLAVEEVGAEVDRFDITLDVLVGVTLNRIERAVEMDSSYMVRAPGATMVVRGTEFFASVDPLGDTRVGVLTGEVIVRGVTPEGEEIGEVAIQPGQQMAVSVLGIFGPVEELEPLPPLPPAEPASRTCGDGECQPGELETCPEDCVELAACGDGLCDPDRDENPVSCPLDCVPPREPGQRVSKLHFFWGEMRCDFDPPTDNIAGPLIMIWGVGCFDSAAHASAHPHPANYQLTVDGQPWYMGSLRQSGPSEHEPYCAWGWNFTLGPVDLEPGAHTLVLTETITDTWSTADPDPARAGRNAGQVVTLTCTLTMEPGAAAQPEITPQPE